MKKAKQKKLLKVKGLKLCRRTTLEARTEPLKLPIDWMWAGPLVACHYQGVQAKRAILLDSNHEEFKAVLGPHVLHKRKKMAQDTCDTLYYQHPTCWEEIDVFYGTPIPWAKKQSLFPILQQGDKIIDPLELGVVDLLKRGEMKIYNNHSLYKGFHLACVLQLKLLDPPDPRGESISQFLQWDIHPNFRPLLRLYGYERDISEEKTKGYKKLKGDSEAAYVEEYGEEVRHKLKSGAPIGDTALRYWTSNPLF